MSIVQLVQFLRVIKFRSSVALRVCDRLNVYVTGLYEMDRTGFTYAVCRGHLGGARHQVLSSPTFHKQ
jgi:hypothetical protein